MSRMDALLIFLPMLVLATVQFRLARQQQMLAGGWMTVLDRVEKVERQQKARAA